MAEAPRRRASLSQLLRGLLGFSFPYLLVMIPAEVKFTAPALGLGLLMLLVARVGSLFEPETLRRGGGAFHIGEAIIVTLVLVMSLVLLHEADYVEIGIAWGTVISIVFLLLYAVALPMITAWRSSTLAEAPARQGLRRVVYLGAFVAEETIALVCIALAAHGHVEARQGPWGLWDLVPIFPMILLVFCYLPLLWFESAAHPGLTEEESAQAAREGALLQVGAVLVAAFTGTAPLL